MLGVTGAAALGSDGDEPPLHLVSESDVDYALRARVHLHHRADGVGANSEQRTNKQLQLAHKRLEEEDETAKQ